MLHTFQYLSDSPDFKVVQMRGKCTSPATLFRDVSEDTGGIYPPTHEDLEETARELRLHTGLRAGWAELRVVEERLRTANSSVNDAQSL